MFVSLKICGPVKSWKRPQDLSNGTPKSFGFCEFETDEGVLRALRLLTKLNIDGQELMVCLHFLITFSLYLCCICINLMLLNYLIFSITIKEKGLTGYLLCLYIMVLEILLT